MIIKNRGRHNATSMRNLFDPTKLAFEGEASSNITDGVEPDMMSPATKKASDKWIWLTTFQRNLTYGSTDPDVPDISLLSEHEKEVIDYVLSFERPTREAERMMKVLSGLAAGFDAMKKMGTIGEEEDEADSTADDNDSPDAAKVSELLLTLRDFVGERIDFARAFVAIGGLSLMLGGAAERDGHVPRSVRSTCLRVLADLVKLNRSVQYSLLDNEGIRALATMYFNEIKDSCQHEADDGKIRGRIVKTMEAAICGHPGAERMFCENEDARKVIESGIGMHAADEAIPSPPAALRKQSLAFLCDLLGPVGQKCKDYPQRIDSFSATLKHIAENMLDETTEDDWECREMAIKILRHVTKTESGRVIVLSMKETIGGTGVKRMEQMRSLDRQNSNASETERVDEELYQWKLLTKELE